jgi:hypothetical protein
MTTTLARPELWCARLWTTQLETGSWLTLSAIKKSGVSQPLLERAFEYWRNIDSHLGDRIVKGITGI